MAALDWLEIEGFCFSDEEAREASDFAEIVSNFEMEVDMVFGLMRDEELAVGRRLLFAAKVTDDNLAFLLLRETDERLIGLIKKRLLGERLKETGGIMV